MELDRARAVSLMMAVTALIVISLSVGFPWYSEGNAGFYLYDSGGEDVLETIFTLIILSVITGWLFLLAILLERQVAAIALGWLSMTSMVAIVAYDWTQTDEISAAGGGASMEHANPILGGFFSVFSTATMAVAVYVEMDRFFKKPKTRNEADWPLQ